MCFFCKRNNSRQCGGHCGDPDCPDNPENKADGTAEVSN